MDTTLIPERDREGQAKLRKRGGSALVGTSERGLGCGWIGLAVSSGVPSGVLSGVPSGTCCRGRGCPGMSGDVRLRRGLQRSGLGFAGVKIL